MFVPDAKIPDLPAISGLSESEALQQVARALGIGISIIDRDFKIVWTNNLVQHENGAGQPQDVIGAHCYTAYYGRQSLCPGCLPLRSFQTGEVYTEVSRRIGRNGQPHYLRITSLPIPSSDGAVNEVMEIAMNVTEERHLQDQLAQAKTLALVGQMAAGLAHEIKNPLAGMKGAIQALQRGYDRIPAGERDEVLGEIGRQIDRLNRNVEDLLAFARPQQPVLGTHDLNDVVAAVTRVLAADPEGVGVAVELELAEHAVGRFDPHLLEQLLLNLAQNALQALDGSGTVTIRTQASAEFLAVEVEDDGPGMPPQVRSRALEPFFTTRHQGTGLGLSIVQRIAAAHDGQVLIHSKPGEGTRVRVLLPQA
jgi:signal transduction histidine kinase